MGVFLCLEELNIQQKKSILMVIVLVASTSESKPIQNTNSDYINLIYYVMMK